MIEKPYSAEKVELIESLVQAVRRFQDGYINGTEMIQAVTLAMAQREEAMTKDEAIKIVLELAEENIGENGSWDNRKAAQDVADAMALLSGEDWHVRKSVATSGWTVECE